MSVLLTLKRLGQEDLEFKANLGSIARLRLKIKPPPTKNPNPTSLCSLTGVTWLLGLVPVAPPWFTSMLYPFVSMVSSTLTPTPPAAPSTWQNKCLLFSLNLCCLTAGPCGMPWVPWYQSQ